MKNVLRKINYLLFSLFDTQKITPSGQEIDVIIPVVKKDLFVLPLCLEGVKLCVAHPVRAIYIVAPNEKEIVSFCGEHRLTYVDETTVFGFGPKELNLKITSPGGTTTDRSGWLFQQLIKLAGTIGTCENYLCIDADHILLQPHAFISENDEPVFYMSPERHRPYYDMIGRLMGSVALAKLSYVAHKMIFNKELVGALQKHIGNHTGKDWVSAIVERYDKTQISGFSEFETYGNFVISKTTLPWKQHAETYKKLDSYVNLSGRFGKKYRSITFPEYYNH